MTTPKPIESLDVKLEAVLVDFAWEVAQDGRADEYTAAKEQAKQALSALITERERVARRDELEQFSWCVYEGCGDYVTERLASLLTQEDK